MLDALPTIFVDFDFFDFLVPQQPQLGHSTTFGGSSKLRQELAGWGEAIALEHGDR